jgi:hypothetical protein
METFAWFEATTLSIWVRESPLVFPTLLIAHALGMGAVVGANVFLAWSLKSPRLHPSFSPLARVVWLGFVASLISGSLLLAAYPAKALTNPTFYLKLALVAAGLLLFARLRQRPTIDRPAIAAVTLLVLWFSAVTAGRFLAYTHSVLLASHLY